MTPAVKQWMKKFYRNGNNVPYRAVSDVHFNINSRATIAKAIQERAVNGMIGSIASGCTCDGLSYTESVLTRVPNVFQEWSYREKGYEKKLGDVDGVSGATINTYMQGKGTPIEVPHVNPTKLALIDFKENIQNNTDPISNVYTGADTARAVQLSLDAMYNNEIKYWDKY